MTWYERILWVATLGLSRKLDDLFELVQAQGVSIMATFDELKTELVSLNATTTELASDIDDLIAKVEGNTNKVLTVAEANEILDGLRATSQGLKAVAARWTPDSQPTQPQ
jgi:hypothetical protein